MTCEHTIYSYNHSVEYMGRGGGGLRTEYSLGGF